MLAGNQRLSVRIDNQLKCLVFTLYEYYRPNTVYEKPYAVPFENLKLPMFDLGRLLEFLQNCMPSRQVAA